MCICCPFEANYSAVAHRPTLVERALSSDETINMTGVLKPLQLLRNVKKDTALRKIDFGEYAPGLYQTIGNVTYSILPRRKKPHLSRCFLDTCVPARVAARLADLEPVNTLFTFEVYANAAVIPPFANAASLEDILEVRASWPFSPEHSNILAADVRILQHRSRKDNPNGSRSSLELPVCTMSDCKGTVSVLATYCWCIGRVYRSSKLVRSWEVARTLLTK